MKEYTVHTIKLQDGTLFNLKRRVTHYATTLTYSLTRVIDGRSNQGKRHPLESILVMLFCALLTGCTTLAECHRWMIHNLRWLKRVIELPHGIPDETTISYALQVCDMESLVTAWNTFRRTVYGKETDTIASMDGKTMRGVHGKDVIRHILSLLTHESLQTIGQIGVSCKENEIPASYRLFDQTVISGLTVVADALHTQKDTVAALSLHHAHYVLIVKENQRELSDAIRIALIDAGLTKDRAIDGQYTRGRTIETIVEITHDSDICSYLISLGWQDVSCIGRIHRRGIRRIRGITTPVDETIYFISSRNDLTAHQAIKIVRNHWKIENNLHWQKDYTYLEDRQTLRLGNAPQVMSFLRSMSISLLKLFKIDSMTEAIENFRHGPRLHHRFLAYAGVV
jgi:predicted transposase YbfD/YdcC